MTGALIEQVGGVFGQLTVTFSVTLQVAVLGYWIESCWAVPPVDSCTANDAAPPLTCTVLSSVAPS
jgi:hypothetical protein